MKIDQVKVIALDKLQLNEGQLHWLKRNPRTWTQTDIDRTKRSIDQDAELMQARPLLAVPGNENGTFVVFAGNLRLTACRALEWPGAPVVVFHPDASEIDRETIHRIALKDNGSFGTWDTDTLANVWNFEPFEMEEWGIPEWVTGGAAGAEQQSGAAGAGAKQTHEDDFDETKEGILVRCKPGDIWELGDHRLMCGDSTDLDTVKALMGGGRS